MKTIESNIIINAKPEKVRSFFLNYQNYPSWNPFLVKFAKYTNKEDPELKVGDELQIDLKLKGFNHTSTMYPKVLQNNEDGLVWRGQLLSTWVFGGTHSFKYELIDGDKTLFTQKEEFTGIIVYVFYLFGLFKKTQESFINLNEVLKDQVENN